jgi:hypothetical protein
MIEHAAEVLQMRERNGAWCRIAKAATIVGHYRCVLRDFGSYQLPTPSVGNSGVQQQHRWSITGPRIPDEVGVVLRDKKWCAHSVKSSASNSE